MIKGLKETMQKEHNYLLNKTYNMIFPIQPRQCLQLALPTIELRNHLHLTKRQHTLWILPLGKEAELNIHFLLRRYIMGIYFQKQRHDFRCIS